MDDDSLAEESLQQAFRMDVVGGEEDFFSGSDDSAGFAEEERVRGILSRGGVVGAPDVKAHGVLQVFAAEINDPAHQAGVKRGQPAFEIAEFQRGFVAAPEDVSRLYGNDRHGDVDNASRIQPVRVVANGGIDLGAQFSIEAQVGNAAEISSEISPAPENRAARVGLGTKAPGGRDGPEPVAEAAAGNEDEVLQARSAERLRHNDAGQRSESEGRACQAIPVKRQESRRQPA